MNFQFTASSPHLKQMRTGGYRLELDLTENEYNQFANLGSPNMQGKLLNINISVTD